jgi:aryl-alcohol dehydrogenase-like predicted oxidoreductase
MPATDKIILGTVQFGLEYGINNRAGKPGQTAVASILDLAFKNNICTLDTAEAYGNSHEVIGNYHRSSSNKFNIITKYSASRHDLPPGLEDRIRRNLKTLGVDSLSGYMYHSAKDFETHYKSFQHDIKSLKDEGLIQKFGVSVYTNNELENLLPYPIDFIQLPFNLLDNHFQRGELLAIAKKKGIEVHTRSAFLQGLFFMKHLPEKLMPLKSYLDKLNNLAETYKIGLADMALNYAIMQKNIDQVLIGVDTEEQLKKNLNALRFEMPAELASQLDIVNVKETELLNPSNWN